MNNDHVPSSSTEQNLNEEDIPNYAPFNVEDSSPSPDIILRSSDKIDFYCHKLVLSLASPIFASMCSLPQEGGGQNECLPIVDVSEQARELFPILSFCDPRCPPPTFLDLDDVSTVLNVADKYEMTGTVKTIGELLKLMRIMIEAYPLRVFAISTRYHLHDVALIAARETLNTPVQTWTDIPEFRHIPASALQRLYQYYFACAKAAVAPATDLGWISERNFIWMRTDVFHSSGCNANFVSRLNTHCREWWIHYIVKVADQLKYAPGSLAASLPTIGMSATKAAAECTQCRTLANQDLHRFNQRLLEKVQEEINKITLPDFH